MDRPNVFEYSSYRKFLSDICDWLRLTKGDRCSKRQLLLRAGFKSSNFLYMLITGRSNVSYKGAIKLAQAMGLDENEQLHLVNLVESNQLQEADEKMRAEQEGFTSTSSESDGARAG